MKRAVAALGAAIVLAAIALGPGRSALLGLEGVSLKGPAAVPVATEAPRAAPAIVAATPGPNAARVSVQVAPAAKLDQGYALSTHLVASDGKALSDTTVRYFEVVELFGQREMPIGESTTDGQGNASVLYLPARLGQHTILARSVGRGTVTWGEARMTFDAQVAAPAYRVEPPPLASFSAVLPYGVGAVVLAVWVALAFALFGTARGVLRGARDQQEGKGDIA